MTPPQFRLRRAEASDLDAVLAIERATENAPHWPPATYAAILDSTATQRCLVLAHAGDSLIGFAVGLIHPAPVHPPPVDPAQHGLASPDPANSDARQRLAELESVVVAANARRVGIGRALCRAVLDWCRSQGATEILLEVRAASAAAVALYAGLGFTRAARRSHYYRDPEDDALLLRLQVSSECATKEGPDANGSNRAEGPAP